MSIAIAFAFSICGVIDPVSTSFKFSIFSSGVTQEMAKAMRSVVEGWQAFVGLAPFLLGAFRWLSFFWSVGVWFFLLVIGGWLVFLRVGIGPVYFVWLLALPSWMLLLLRCDG